MTREDYEELKRLRDECDLHTIYRTENGKRKIAIGRNGSQTVNDSRFTFITRGEFFNIDLAIADYEREHKEDL